MRRTRLVEDPTAMTTSSEEGLVKKLFFPAYTDAGFNESFGNMKSQQQQLDSSITESVVSEASTAVRDNRSNPAMPATNRFKNQQQHQHQQTSNKQLYPPSFFASTKPAYIQHPQHPHMPVPPSPAAANNSMPVSPPKLARSTSTTAVVNTSTTTADNKSNSRFPFADDVMDDDNSSGTSFEDATSIAIVRTSAAAMEAAIANVTEEALHLRSAESDGSSSISMTTQQQAAAGISIFDDTTEIDVGGSDRSSWEEEATPAQTAFGKMLLFKRVLAARDKEDVSSTASENGSVLDVDVDGAIQAAHCAVAGAAVADVVDDKNESGSTNKSLYTTPPQEEYSDPVWDDDSNLLLPVFDENNTTTTGAEEDKKPAARIVATKPLHEDEKKAQEPETKQRAAFLMDDSGGVPSNSAMGGATGMLSMAIRRLGSGLTGNSSSSSSNNNHRFNSASAPTTPRASSSSQSYYYNNAQQPRSPTATPTTPRSYLTSSLQRAAADESSSSNSPRQSLLPSSFLLRSPGSSAFQEASAKKKKSISSMQIPPRFTSWQGNQPHQRRSMFGKIPENEEATRDDDNKLVRPNNSNNAFQIARSCFSFDAYDTSMDDQYDFTVPNHYSTNSAVTDSRQLPTLDLDTSVRQHMEQEAVDPLAESEKHTRWINTAAAELSFMQNPPVGQVLSGSTSWDVGFVPPQQKQQRAPAFRPRPERTRGGLASVLRPATSFSSSPSRRSGARVRITSDFSPTSASAAINNAETQQLKSPQRIEIEREDALDILACLVERGVSWKQEDIFNGEDADALVGKEGVGVATVENDKSERSNQDHASLAPSMSEIAAIVKELQDLSLAEEKLGDFHNNSEAHHKRKLALEELLRSHEYAIEMKRASQSASFWLKSIGRSQSSSPSKSISPARNIVISEEATASDSPSQSGLSQGETPDGSQQAAGEESSAASDNIDLLTAKAMLHSAQIEAKEKSELADRLNEELAKCRAEIGRLKSSAQLTSFRSPNRSILDESDDISVTEVDEEDEDMHVHDRVIDESDCLDSSFLREGSKDDDSAVEKAGSKDDDFAFNGTESKNDEAAEGESELERYRSALDEANAVIRKLYSDLKRDGEVDGAPVIQIPKMEDIPTVPSDETPGINVRMLDVENFVTDWAELAPPLPGPPDHGLRSPIVAAVLEAWTSERSLHESLLTWIDQILAGADPNSVPPLTLSSLDHQACDGFTLHVLPLLLRRSGIRLDVKKRVHRSTFYDLAVSVDAATGRDLPPHLSHHNIRRQLETTSARSDVGSSTTNSSTTTALISNTARASLKIYTEAYGDNSKGIEGITPVARAAVSTRLSYDEMAEDITSSDDAQPGLMSALGGALGGLLTRRKGVASHESLPPHGPQGGMQTILESPASAGLAHEIVGLAEADDDQPYHRVVSAPPGRIGVTFVEYRGHCMVSDVYPDSPLIGWIFPSDVLIAIDDLPVSGMRVRDIIKVLKDRTMSTQRALRVISSHAMNEFTLNASVVADEAG